MTIAKKAHKLTLLTALKHMPTIVSLLADLCIGSADAMRINYEEEIKLLPDESIGKCAWHRWWLMNLSLRIGDRQVEILICITYSRYRFK